MKPHHLTLAFAYGCMFMAGAIGGIHFAFLEDKHLPWILSVVTMMGAAICFSLLQPEEEK